MCILEKCRDGKSFFGIIPEVWNSGGWRHLLGVVSSVVEKCGGVRPEERRPGLGPKSFVEVVAPRIFSREGSCSNVLGEEEAIRVKEEGVEERLSFLRQGLVFRLEVFEGVLPDWKRFRARRWRGFSNLEGGSSRVTAFVLIGGWITSDLVGQRGWSWFLVKCIPLHLRLDALLRDVALRLGETAVFDVAGYNLNEVKVRVKDNSKVPEGIWIHFREKRFWLPVLKMESGGPRGVGSKVASGARLGEEATGGQEKGQASAVCVVESAEVSLPPAT
ncbi:hypothetical protein LINPERHAP1_LOCUS455, partial [Linum perenne]